MTFLHTTAIPFKAYNKEDLFCYEEHKLANIENYKNYVEDLIKIHAQVLAMEKLTPEY